MFLEKLHPINTLLNQVKCPWEAPENPPFSFDARCKNTYSLFFVLKEN